MVEAPIPVSKSYALSKAVLLGVVEKANRETGAVEASVKTVLHGDGFSGVFRMKIDVAEVRARVAVGDPVVLMLSKRDPKKNIIHVSDAWMDGELDSTKTVPFYVAGLERKDFRHNFPGSTATLIRILEELKATQKVSLVDKVDPAIFTKGISDIGKLSIGDATAVVAGDFDGDKKPDLAVATAAGVTVYSLDGGIVAPSKTAAPKNFPPKLTFAPDKGTVLAAVAGEFGPNGERSAIVVRGKEITREGLDDNIKVPVDGFQRLTGDVVKVFFAAVERDGLKSAIATDIDVNGDGLRDVLVITEDVAIVMPNRGYGAFFVIAKVKDLLAKDGKYPFAIDAGTKLTATDLDGDKKEELIIVTAEGRVLVAK